MWGTGLREKYNQFLGFYTKVDLDEEQELEIRITARSYYRLYVNGKISACGPSRTAKHHCRIDVHTLRALAGFILQLRRQPMNKPEKYCNDCTLEPGMLAAEVADRRRRDPCRYRERWAGVR